MNFMKIIFFGTDIFAKIILENLLNNNIKIEATVTKADDFVGRKKEL